MDALLSGGCQSYPRFISVLERFCVVDSTTFNLEKELTFIGQDLYSVVITDTHFILRPVDAFAKFMLANYTTMRDKWLKRFKEETKQDAEKARKAFLYRFKTAFESAARSSLSTYLHRPIGAKVEFACVKVESIDRQPSLTFSVRKDCIDHVNIGAAEIDPDSNSFDDKIEDITDDDPTGLLLLIN